MKRVTNPPTSFSPSTSATPDITTPDGDPDVKSKSDAYLPLPLGSSSQSKVDLNRPRTSLGSRQSAAMLSLNGSRLDFDNDLLQVGIEEPDKQRKKSLSIQHSEDNGSDSTSRSKLLDDYLGAISRTVNADHAVAALKLRHAAQVHFGKSEFSRLVPRAMQSAGKVRELLAMDVDVLLRDVRDNPQKYSRSLLHRVAEQHFVQALAIDHEAFMKGVRLAAPLEGLHSAAARVVTVAGSLTASSALEFFPGAEELASEGAKAIVSGSKKAVKFVGRQLPSSVINPILSGKMRITTGVKQLGRLEGGQAQLASNIGKSHDMGVVAGEIAERLAALKAANAEYRNGASHDEGREILKKVVGAYLSLHEAANDTYKSRIGANRTQTYGKAWGAGVNALSAVGGVMTVAVPGIGQVAGPIIQAAAVGAQMGAGYYDKITEQRYSVHANTKWGDFLTEAGKRVPYEALTAAHIDVDQLRAAHATQAELRVAGVREVYMHELAKLLGRADRLQDKVDKGEARLDAGKPAANLPRQKAALTALNDRIEEAKKQAKRFESMNPLKWESIPRESTIGKCLDDPDTATRLLLRARHGALGEATRLILQRYDQAFHAGLSTGLLLPITDALTMADSLHVDGSDGRPLKPDVQAATIGLGGVGSVVSVGVTGEVRMSKSENKDRLTARVDVEKSRRADKKEQDEATWVFEAGDMPGDKPVDLRTSVSYDKLYHTRSQRAKRFFDAAGRSLVSGPVGVYHLAKAKAARHEARQVMQETLSLLRANLDTEVSAPTRQRNFAAMKEVLLAYPEVLSALRSPAHESGKGKGKVVVDIPTIELPDKDRVLPAIDLEEDLRTIRAAKQEKLAAAASTSAAANTSSGSAGPPPNSIAIDITDDQLLSIMERLGV